MPPLELTGPAGRLEALIDEPSSAQAPPRAAVVLGHPHPLYGGTMHTKAVYQTAKALARIGCSVLRFNFRGVGASAGAFGDGTGEQEDFRAAVAFMAARHPDARLWAAGMSFGSWVALSVGAGDPRVAALIAVSMPVGRYDFEAVAGSRTPKFLIHGEFDEICPLKDVRAFYARASEPKELVVIEAADHLFTGHVSQLAEAVEDLLGDF
jgi:uncharacterized protein